MKTLAALFALSILLVLVSFQTVKAADEVVIYDPAAVNPLEEEAVIVTALPFGTNTAFVEVYNQGEHAQWLGGYSIVLSFADDTETLDIDESIEVNIDLPERYLLADGYLALVNTAEVADNYLSFQLPIEAQDLILQAIEVVNPENVRTLQISEFAPTQSRYTWLKRKQGNAGLDTKQSAFTQQDGSVEIASHGLFSRPNDAPSVKIVEILPRSASCAPDEDSLLCGDYIKLYNSGPDVVYLDDFVLRSDSGSAKSGNSFALNFEMAADSYLTIHLRDNGDPLVLNDSGGYVWLEDRANIAPYKSSIVEYPSAGTGQIGASWIVDLDGVWRWSSTPQPNMANLFTDQQQAVNQDLEPATLASCGEGRYRHPETNRCRNIETASPALVACGPGQERNPATNRCRNVTSASTNLVPCSSNQERNPLTNRCRNVVATTASLQPCGIGQERNPETNRCRSISANKSDLVPCDPGQERNPETNRCRKVAGSVLSEDTQKSELEPMVSPDRPVAWYGLAGAVVAVAAGYGVWEWRSEIAAATGRLKSFATKK